MGRVEDKVAIVTGGALGIGRATSLLLAKEGAKVAVTDIQDQEGQQVVDEIKSLGKVAQFWHLDVTSGENVRNAFADICKTFGRIDVLVNNAGIVERVRTTHEITEEEWDKVIAVNLKGVFFCTKHVIPHMKEGGGGSIINVSSIYGIVGSDGGAAYRASKGAVRLMAKTEAILYAKDNIRANSVHPGFIWTPMVENALKARNDVVEGRKRLDSLHPVGHVGEPEDIAYGILYLASDESKFVTGSELVIDGGYTAQ